MDDHNYVDVVILGGSVPGLISALKLGSQGLSVVIIDIQDNNQHLDYPGSIIVSKLAFQKMQIPYLEKGFKNQNKYAAYVHRSLDLMRIHLSSLSIETILNAPQDIRGDLLFDRNSSLIIDSKLFKRFLLHLIKKYDSQIYTCTKFNWITTNSPFAIHLLTNENESKIINCKYLIIDTVLTEDSFRDLGFIPPKIFSKSHFLELEGLLTDSIDVFFDSTIIPSGFLLVYPLTKSTQFCLVTSGNNNLIQFEKLQTFIKKFYLLEDPLNLHWSSPKLSHSFDKNRILYNNNIILVGDAIGLTNPLTFSDFLASIQSALLASSAIVTLTKNTNVSFAEIAENIFLKEFLNFPYTDSVHEEASRYFYNLSNEKLFHIAKILHYYDLSKLTWYQKRLINIKLFQNHLHSDTKQLQNLWKSFELNRKWLI